MSGCHDSRRGAGCSDGVLLQSGSTTLHGRILSLTVMVVLALAVALSVAIPGNSAYAAGRTANEGSVTDTQNLLGGKSAKVDDAIASTLRDTGVTVRLLYLKNFTGSKNAESWVADALQAMNPRHNTVLLAVASDDGQLVVAVSKNSDQWLQKKSNVNKLSKAAIKPLEQTDIPDWPGSALAMMDEIKSIKHTRQTVRLAIIVGVVVALLVVAGVAGWVISGRRHPDRKHDKVRHRRID